MIVAELVSRLSGLDQDALVVLASDAEGNYYSPVYGAFEARYVPDGETSGDVVDTELTEEMREQGYTEEDIYTGGYDKPAVVLYPFR